MNYTELGTSAEKDYISGLETLRQKINGIQSEALDCEREHAEYASEGGWTESEYKFNSCLEFLSSKNLKMTSIDSEARMLTMINDLRATGAEPELISFVTQYWENFHQVMTVVDALREKYYTQILTKLLLMFNNQMVFPVDTALTVEYGNEIMLKMSTIDHLYQRLTALCQTYQTKVDKELFEMVSQEALVIIRLPRDVIVKLKILISLSTEILNREEAFVSEMTSTMLECHKKKLEYEKKLAEKRQMHLDKINSVYLATMLLEQNKAMVQQLDKELDDLQTQLNNKENALHSTEVEMEKDQNAIEFLNHTISSAKRNQRLLIKRQHLLKTRQSLEKKLEQIKGELKSVNEVLHQKTIKKNEMHRTLEQTTTSHSTVTEDLSNFANILDEIERETKGVHSQLIDIEIIHCIKTSPENLEELRDRPQSVKIARSLRDKITRRRLQGHKFL